jgi:hypothetical protein
LGTLARKQRWREEVPAIGTTGAAAEPPGTAVRPHWAPHAPARNRPPSTATISFVPHPSDTLPVTQFPSSQVLKFRCSGQSRSPLHLHPSPPPSSEVVPKFRSPQGAPPPHPPTSLLSLSPSSYFFNLRIRGNNGTSERYRQNTVLVASATGTRRELRNAGATTIIIPPHTGPTWAHTPAKNRLPSTTTISFVPCRGGGRNTHGDTPPPVLKFSSSQVLKFRSPPPPPPPPPPTSSSQVLKFLKFRSAPGGTTPTTPPLLLSLSLFFFFNLRIRGNNGTWERYRENTV